MKDGINYYKNNKKYELFLSRVDTNLYSKYIQSVIFSFSNEKSIKFLDVGCGVGTVARLVSSGDSKIKPYGIDVSENFVKKAQVGKGNFRVFDGKKIPFKNGSFDVVGCFTVLEHVENTVQILREIVRVTKPGGRIIVAGPSFLRVFGFSATHWRTKGLLNPIKNLAIDIYKYLQTIFSPKDLKFRFMKQLVRDDFQADDDAICETNMIDVRHFLKSFGVDIQYQSGLVDFHCSPAINKFSEIPIIRDLTGGYFIMGVKK
jgi:ubiquinone/menaquinone biosynthesis C-methylase UbiE